MKCKDCGIDSSETLVNPVDIMCSKCYMRKVRSEEINEEIEEQYEDSSWNLEDDETPDAEPELG